MDLRLLNVPRSIQSRPGRRTRLRTAFGSPAINRRTSSSGSTGAASTCRLAPFSEVRPCSLTLRLALLSRISSDDGTANDRDEVVDLTADDGDDVGSKPKLKVEAEAKLEVKAEAKLEVKAEAKLEVKAEAKLEPVAELYDGHAAEAGSVPRGASVFALYVSGFADLWH